MSLKAVDMVVDSCLQSGASFASFYESLGIQEFMDKEHNGVLQGGKGASAHLCAFRNLGRTLQTALIR